MPCAAWAQPLVRKCPILTKEVPVVNVAQAARMRFRPQDTCPPTHVRHLPASFDVYRDHTIAGRVFLARSSCRTRGAHVG